MNVDVTCPACDFDYTFRRDVGADSQEEARLAATK